MILNNLFESRYGAAAGVETIRQLVHAVKNSADIDLKVGPEMFPVNYGDARYLLQYWKANREGGDATAEYFGNANWIESKLAKRDHTMSPDRLKDMDQERMKSKDYDRMLGIDEYAVEPTSPQDKQDKLKSLQALLVDPNTNKDPQMKQAIQKRLAQLQEDQTPKRRIMDFDNHALYWSGVGPLAKEYTELQNKLVPYSGKADTIEGELLRAVGKIIYRHGNDGDHFSHGSYAFIEKHVGKFDNLDDMATKVVQYALDKKGQYTPNPSFDWLATADYGPGKYEKDWELEACQNCGGDGEVSYTNDEGEEETEECDHCDGEGTHEYIEGSAQVKEETEYQLWWKGEEIDSFASKEEAVAMQKEYTMAYKGGVFIKKAKVKESFFDPREKKIPSPTSDNPVTKRVEEDESPRKMYHKHFVKAMKAMPGSQVQKRHQLEMEKYKKMMGKSFIDQVAPKEFAKFDRKVEEGYPTDYKGWKYDIEYIEDEDTRKKLHSATKDGKQVSIDWSPYSNMSDEQFKTWIDLGMPGRKDVNSIGPLQPEDLEQLMKTKLGTRARLAQEDKPTDIELDVLKYTDEQVAKAITIARGSDGDMTGATDTIEAIADGLSNHPDVEKVLKTANEAKDSEHSDITKKLDPRTKVALKKAQMKSAGLTKGDPIASLAFGLERDVDRLDKENDKEEADIASQELVDKYHSQELEALKKSLTDLLKK